MICAKILRLICAKFYHFQYLSTHTCMLICSRNTIFLLFPTYTVWKDTAPGISASPVYWSRFDSGCRQNDQLPALVCLEPHAFGFRAVAQVVGCRVYLVEIMSGGYVPKFLFQSSCPEIFLHRVPKFRHTALRWTLRRNFGAIRLLLWICQR